MTTVGTEALSMTGRELWQHVTGKTSYRNHEVATFRGQNGRIWSIWPVVGRGRHSRHLYFHLSTRIKCRFGGPPDIVHTRGRSGEQVRTYQEVI